jgi:hypothetical protein
MDGDTTRQKAGGAAVRPLGDAVTHYWLAKAMSQTVGLDLQAEIAAGRFSQQDWADTVRRCRGCDWAGDCPSWMAGHPEAERAPDACVNAERFNALLARTPAPGAAEEG